MVAGPRWYRIAGLTLRLDGDVLETDLLETRYGPFRVDPGPPDLRLEIESASGYHNREVAEGLVDPPHRLRDGLWTVHRIDYQGVFVARDHLRARTDGTVGALNGLLRHVLVGALLDRAGLLLHAAAVRAAGQVAVLAGPSGAGKSTACRHAPPATEVLGDEQTALVPRDGLYWAYGTPIIGELARPGRPGGGPVGSIDFLSHAARNDRERLDAHQAMRRLLAVTVFYPRDPGSNARAIAACASIARTVPAFDLAVLGDGSFWPMLLPASAAAS